MSMESEFDEVVDRRNTNCGKWDMMDQKYRKKDMIHLGVADMDFKAPEPVRNALYEILNHGVLGYTDPNENFFEAIRSWYQKRYQLDIPREWIVFCPRINISAGLCIEEFTKEKDEVMLQAPAYGPLKKAIIAHNRMMLTCPLKLVEGTYKIDFEQMESSITTKTKMLLLCNPHNPTTRCWSREEILMLAKFCVKHNLLVFSDEIHGDLIKEGITHHTLISYAKEFGNRLVVASSPSKTFNIPGVIVSYMIIPDESIRGRIENAIDRVGMHNPTIFAVDALIKCYTECDTWYEQMKCYIDENERFVRSFISSNINGFKVLPREATYLLWIDYHGTGKTEEEMEQWFIEKANLSVYMGSVFSEEGRGFFRLNLATSKVRLQEALNRMKQVVDW